MFSKVRFFFVTHFRLLVCVHAAVLLLLLCTGAYVHYGLPFSKDPFDPAAVVLAMGKGDKTVFEEVRDSIKQIIDVGGIQGMIDVNEYALVNNYYGIYQCHVISHLTGHEAVVFYGQDYEAVIGHDNHFCEVGYRHGAEAQVALSGGDYKNELYDMCSAIKHKNPGAECFHGAGHAFMNETLDVEKSLSMCEDLVNDTYPEQEVVPCYNAVFAELTNLVGGTDGGTGIEYTGGAPLTLSESSPIEYCAKFDKEHYRVQCVFEFSGLGVNEFTTDDVIAEKLIQCTGPAYDQTLQEACIKSVSAVGAQHTLALQQTVVVPPLIQTLSESLRQAYIVGVGTEMKQYIVSGAPRDYVSFCGSFLADEDIALCLGIFDSI